MRISEVKGNMMDYEDLLMVEIRGENVTRFLHDWDKVLHRINVEIDEELIDLKHKVNFFAGQTIISPVVNHFQTNVTSPHIMI